jgi:4-azaleucine resistance transporter AzlC
MSRKQEFIDGIVNTIPLLIGAFPFGLIYGALAVSSGFSVPAVLAMSAFVFAGSSQFIAIGLVATQTPVAIIILTTLIVNLRHLLYSASLLPYIKGLSQGWKIPLAFWLTDETYAVTIHYYQKVEASIFTHWYQLGSSIAMYLNWQLWSFLGILLGENIPDVSTWGLDVAMPIAFIGMTIPFVNSPSMLICVLVAGAMSLLTYTLPYKSGIFLSTFVGITAGLLTNRRRKRIFKRDNL